MLPREVPKGAAVRVHLGYDWRVPISVFTGIGRKFLPWSNGPLLTATFP